MPLEIISLFLPGGSWGNDENLYSVKAMLYHMYRNDCRSNSHAQIFILVIEMLSVFCFALNKVLHSMIQFSR